ncbi:unnamed protein product [Nesidiocoris tenuis]|uniref:Zinc finger protein-like 1 homolog n=1 Tax=Nesidiocoris tenuis TaxID=355587 RepID=A0A6H5GTL4_9HEMI|nr:unnamed protein product [Nesidiocoris tenuis]
MGLCKCPKKTVTTMFCYEHRVNVCQHCMVANHQSCVVQSYLNWLKDTEFDSTCTLCHDDMKNSECVRLLCYHLFHWDCLGKYFGSLPRTTAPAGYKCPICSSGIIPHPNLVSPVADELRKKLKSTIWGKEDLTSLSDSNENSKPTGETARAFYECETQSAGRPALNLFFQLFYKRTAQLFRNSSSPGTEPTHVLLIRPIACSIIHLYFLFISEYEHQ